MKLDIVLVEQTDMDRVLAQLRPAGKNPNCLFLPFFGGAVVLHSPRVVAMKIHGSWYQPYLHQLVCEWHNGKVPRGKVVRHLCGFCGCGYYGHLVIGTHQENRWDREFHRANGTGILAPRAYDQGWKMKKPYFSSARNVHHVEPRCCFTCAFLQFDGSGMASCGRPDGPEWDVSLQEYLYTVCDLWRSQLHQPLDVPTPDE